MNSLPSLLIGLALVSMNMPSQAQQYRPAGDSAEFKALAAVVVSGVRAELGQAVVVDIDTVTRNGDWAFVTAALLDDNGRAYRYLGTPLEEAAAAGGVSNAYAGLLRLRGDAWTLVTRAVGPGDVAWENWPSKYGAPASLFGF